VSDSPLFLRLAVGNVTAARASLLVLNHLNGLAPSGAEAAVDRAMGGAISRRAAAGALDAPFGSSHFLPAARSPLAADAVLVLSLGEAGKLDPRRLSELGAAIVDAAVAVGARDVATIVHGAGAVGVPVGRAARRLVEGLLRAVVTLPGGRTVREVTVVERDETKAAAARRALRAAAVPDGLEVVLDARTERLPPARDPDGDGDGVPAHLRLGVTRAGSGIKVTRISDAAYDAADSAAYPRAAAQEILDAVRERVLRGRTDRTRARAMAEVGRRLWGEFLAWPRFDVGASLRAARGGYVVLRLDESTVDLPWEIGHAGGRFLGRAHVLARQREIAAPGHPAAWVPDHERLRALVVGDPTGDLPAAAAEAVAVARDLTELGADVRSLGAGATRAGVLAALQEHDPDVLHYCGHARFDPLRQEAGGLQLADSPLTADDLGSQPHLPRLVFANACNSAQTGDVADQALFDGAAPTRDLAGKLLAAGARAFVGSQWRVEDKAAATFARAFYRALAGARGPGEIGRAVLSARGAVVRRHGAGEPAWASYALYGSPWKRAL
jgi:hypothetical protein